MFPFSPMLTTDLGVLEVTASNVVGLGFGSATCAPISGSNTPNVQVSGGSGSYTYSWTKISDADGNDFVITTATSQDPTFSGFRCDFHVDNEEEWKCTVTDTVTGRQGSVTITVNLAWGQI